MCTSQISDMILNQRLNIRDMRLPASFGAFEHWTLFSPTHRQLHLKYHDNQDLK